MPPSPALRCSPSKELPGKKHRRGHSIEYGTLFRDKDEEEDLALFSELQEKERDDFLLQSSDDLEDAFSTKLKHFSEFTIPIQGESSSRLLGAEEDKNDYDWLLTPPDTPLFPSLDDEPPTAASVGTRGRPQSQKTSLSRSSTMEKRRRSSRGSPSPNRLSTSPRDDSIRGRSSSSSSARHPSPASAQQRSVTPVRRISPSPGKPLSSRSSTPTSRRMSTGSTTTTAPPAGRGPSPVRSSRGSSASPKTKVWQSNIPGFSLDAPPPNLRTSLGDRPASYVRGSSPASRNGRDASSIRSRQSVSPSASRSVSSSHSHEDVHPIQSVPASSSERAGSKRASLSPNSRTSRSSSKLQSPGSAPRRPFESALRQMDHHPKSHHSMFRPLASSLPSTGIYSGKSTSSSYHHIMLRHSSATVGSSSSSSQVIGFMPDTKRSDPVPVTELESLACLAYPVKHGESMDVLNEGSRHESHESSFSDQGFAVESESSVNEEFNVFLEGAVLETMEVCGRCGSHYLATETTRSEINICPDCREEHSFVGTRRALDENSQSQENFDENESFVEKIPPIDVIESLPAAMVEAKIVETRENTEQCDDSHDQEQNHLQESSRFRDLGEQDDEIVSSTGCGLSTTETKDIQSHQHDVKIGSSEGSKGVPMPIKRSVSMKSPITKASNSIGFTRSYDGFSYLRDKSMSLRSSTETTSASSSWDYGSSIRKGSHVRHQSGSTLDMETHRYDTTTNSKFMNLSSMSSTSGVSSHSCQALNVMPADSTNEETHQESKPDLQDSKCDETNVMNADLGEIDGSFGLSTNVVGVPAEIENVFFCHDGDDVLDNTAMGKVEEISESPAAHVRSTSEVGASTATDDCSLYDHSKLQEKDVNETPHTTTASETEPESCEPETPGLGVDDETPECNNVNAVDDDDCSEKNMAHASVDHHNSLAPLVNEISDESTVLVECPGQKEPKSLTLEEATDAILFCSSIVHDLVYQAASIAMDKGRDVAGTEEEEEILRPTVTVLGKSNANRSSYTSGGGTKTNKKQSSKVAKASRKQMETEEKTEVHIENDENAGEAAGMMISNVGVLPSNNKADNLKPPPKLENKCNCSIM